MDRWLFTNAEVVHASRALHKPFTCQIFQQNHKHLFTVLSFLQADVTQVIEIISHGRQEATNFYVASTVLAITLSHQQNTHVFADGRKKLNDIFNNYVCSESHICAQDSIFKITFAVSPICIQDSIFKCLARALQYHGCWWPDNAGSQSISNHDIDLVKLR